MKKYLLISLLISITLSLIIVIAMSFIPLPESSSNSSPDTLIEKNYGFPMTFKTTTTGGIAGNLPGDATIDLANLLIDAGIVAVLVFVISFGTMSLLSHSKWQ